MGNAMTPSVARDYVRACTQTGNLLPKKPHKVEYHFMRLKEDVDVELASTWKPRWSALSNRGRCRLPSWGTAIPLGDDHGFFYAVEAGKVFLQV
jgi:hypothetical protein